MNSNKAGNGRKNFRAKGFEKTGNYGKMRPWFPVFYRMGKTLLRRKYGTKEHNPSGKISREKSPQSQDRLQTEPGIAVGNFYNDMGGNCGKRRGGGRQSYGEGRYFPF